MRVETNGMHRRNAEYDIYKQSKFCLLLSFINHHQSLLTFFITHTSSINNTNTMLFSTLIASLGLATAVSAITVTAPSNSTGWTSTGAQVIEWDVSPVFFCLSPPSFASSY
jgi:hypothetical protein